MKFASIIVSRKLQAVLAVTLIPIVQTRTYLIALLFLILLVLVLVLLINLVCNVQLVQTVNLMEIVIPLVRYFLLAPKFVLLADLTAEVNTVSLPLLPLENALTVLQILNVPTEKIVPCNSTRVPSIVPSILNVFPTQTVVHFVILHSSVTMSLLTTVQVRLRIVFLSLHRIISKHGNQVLDV